MPLLLLEAVWILRAGHTPQALCTAGLPHRPGSSAYATMSTHLCGHSWQVTLLPLLVYFRTAPTHTFWSSGQYLGDLLKGVSDVAVPFGPSRSSQARAAVLSTEETQPY